VAVSGGGTLILRVLRCSRAFAALHRRGTAPFSNVSCCRGASVLVCWRCQDLTFIRASAFYASWTTWSSYTLSARKLGVRRGMHRFRDTLATSLLVQGVSIEIVTTLLGPCKHEASRSGTTAPWVKARQDAPGGGSAQHLDRGAAAPPRHDRVKGAPRGGRPDWCPRVIFAVRRPAVATRCFPVAACVGRGSAAGACVPLRCRSRRRTPRIGRCRGCPRWSRV
jgi:hypothetical protein